MWDLIKKMEMEYPDESNSTSYMNYILYELDIDTVDNRPLQDRLGDKVWRCDDIFDNLLELENTCNSLYWFKKFI